MHHDNDQRSTSFRRGLAAIIASCIRLLRWTWRIRFCDRSVFDDALARGPAVFAFWHGEQLPMVPIHAERRIAGLASLSEDGQLLAEVIEKMGYQVVRGSSSRGGVRAFRDGLRALDCGVSPALAVDGPRGPFHEVQKGVAGLSAQSGRPIIYVVSRSWPVLRFRSWDRFQIPLPWARVEIAYGLMAAPQNERQAIDVACSELQTRMVELAEQLRSSPCCSSGG